MNVVIPLSGVPLGLALLFAFEIARLIEVVFQNEMDLAIGVDGTPDCIGQFREDVWGRVVNNRVHRIETEAVEMIFGQPVERIVDEEVSDGSTFGPIEINAISPWSTVSISKELWRVRPKIISFRAQVVVHDVEENHDSMLMGALNQFFEIFGSAVNTIGSEWEDAVVAPIALAGEVSNGHQLHGSDSQIHEIVESLPHRGKRPGWRESSDMQFIDDRLFPWAPTPGLIAPIEGKRIDHFARPMNIPRLKPGGWVGDFTLTINPKIILTP